jgi:hypothetical protein
VQTRFSHGGYLSLFQMTRRYLLLLRNACLILRPLAPACAVIGVAIGRATRPALGCLPGPSSQVRLSGLHRHGLATVLECATGGCEKSPPSRWVTGG